MSRLWMQLKLAFRKRPVVHPQLPFELDEFAKLLSSRDPTALKQLARGLARPTAIRSRKLQA